MTQTTGYYFQYSIFQIPFHTDAFGQLREGEGRAIDGGAAESWWLDGWTILYVSALSNSVTIFSFVVYFFQGPHTGL